MLPQTDLCFCLQFSLVCNRKPPHSAIGGLSHGSRNPGSWESLACHFHHRTRWHNPSTLHSEHQQQLQWPYTSHHKYKVYVHHPLQWVFGSQELRRRYSASSWSSWSPSMHHRKQLFIEIFLDFILRNKKRDSILNIFNFEFYILHIFLFISLLSK